jgi:hypothetical protein
MSNDRWGDRTVNSDFIDGQDRKSLNLAATNAVTTGYVLLPRRYYLVGYSIVVPVVPS